MAQSGDESVRRDIPEVLPEGVSAVRYLSAAADGVPFISYRTLDQALADPQATMIFEADSGGQILLSCPVRHVRASAQILEQLLTDLEMIAWGPGIDHDEHKPSEVLY